MCISLCLMSAETREVPDPQGQKLHIIVSCQESSGNKFRSSAREAIVLTTEPSLQSHAVMLMILLFKLSKSEDEEEHKVLFFYFSSLNCLYGLSILSLWELEIERTEVCFFFFSFPFSRLKNVPINNTTTLSHEQLMVSVTLHGLSNHSSRITHEYDQKKSFPSSNHVKHFFSINTFYWNILITRSKV